MKRLFLLTAFLFFYMKGQYIYAQTEECPANRVYISTGYNHNTNTTYPAGMSEQDAFWQVIVDPDDIHNVPRPATVINPCGCWGSGGAAFSNTQWISTYPTAADDRNGTYVFQHKFCLADLSGVLLYLKIHADDIGEIYLNPTITYKADGNIDNIQWNNNDMVVSTTGMHWGFNDTPNEATISDPTRFKIGENILIAKVQNTGHVAMGLDLYGYVEGNVGSVLKQSCCDPNSSISGKKWNDLNGDGARQSGEPIIAGWSITLNSLDGGNSYTAVTDGLGDYYFMNIPPGDYSLSEVNQNGWLQTYPADRFTTITLNTNEAIRNRNFGNQYLAFPQSELPCRDCIPSFSPEPGKKYLVSAWVKEKNALPDRVSYDYPNISIQYFDDNLTPAGNSSGPFKAKDEIIDGWQRIEEVFTIPSPTKFMNIKLGCSSGECFFDDIRIFPIDGSMKSYVYDPITLRLVAELDERNYATFYEYDEEGKLVRVKKETERGVMTIKENKNSMKKR